MEETMKTWLFTWNPKNYTDGGDGQEDYQLDLDIGKPIRWSCSSQSPQIGDTAYLVRLGVYPKGIIAKGRISSDPYMAEDWRDSSKQKSYIDIEFTEHRPTSSEGILPLLLLEQGFASQRWTPQASGITISSDIAGELNELWDIGEGLHSLKQYFTWLGQNDFNPTWKESYKSITEWSKAVQSGERELDDEYLHKLWKDTSNGVASLKQGGLSNVEYENNKDFLLDLSKIILKDPDSQTTFDAVFDNWEGKKESGDFRQINKALIHRAFAAISPENFTTIARFKMCKKLAQYLKQAFELDIEVGEDWFQTNNSIAQALNTLDLQDQRTDCNRHLWRIYDTQFNKEKIEEEQEEESENDSMNNISEVDNASLNQILYGPPGTGKTYHTINKALSIIDPAFYEVNKGSRSKLKARFDELKQEGRIEFVTFHQSFSYEDFVEGLQANSNDEGQISYDVVSGVFKRVCEAASATQSTHSVDEAIAEFQEKVSGQWMYLSTTTGKKFQVSYKGGKTFRIKPDASDDQAEFPANVGFVRDTILGNKVERLYNASYVKGIAEHIIKEYKVDVGSISSESVDTKPYILLIDEINRGNIAKIFGELITLIESSKRQGESEALSVKLPYSKTEFTVPKNLYIIGTMNTADRSLAQLDIALRRRFVFHEMMPNPDLLNDVPLIQGINVGKILKAINERIELLYDREHTIGHSHFMSLDNEDNATLSELRSIFENQIIPLLEEYFFEDWDLIGKVLGDHNKSRDLRFIKPKFKNGDIERLMGAEWAADYSKQVFERNESALSNPQSYIGIYEKLTAEDVE